MEEKIIHWVMYDNKIKDYQTKIKKIKEQREGLSEEIFEGLEVDMEKSNKEMPKYNIESLNAKLQIQKSNIYESLNYKFLETSFSEYFQCPEKAKELIDYIRNKRQKETKLQIKREYLID